MKWWAHLTADKGDADKEHLHKKSPKWRETISIKHLNWGFILGAEPLNQWKIHLPCKSVCFAERTENLSCFVTSQWDCGMCGSPWWFWDIKFAFCHFHLQTRRWSVLIKAANIVERPRKTQQGRNAKHQQEPFTFPIAKLDELAANTWQRRNFEDRKVSGRKWKGKQ